MSHDLYPCRSFSKQTNKQKEFLAASEVFQEFGNDDVGPVANLPGFSLDPWDLGSGWSSNPTHMFSSFQLHFGQFSQLFEMKGFKKCLIYIWPNYNISPTWNFLEIRGPISLTIDHHLGTNRSCFRSRANLTRYMLEPFRCFQK